MRNRRNGRINNKCFITALCAALIVSVMPQADVSAEEEYRTIESYRAGTAGQQEQTVKEEDYVSIIIKTEDDLRELAESCGLDSWSVGKKVELQSDIVLTGEEFSIPTFAGIFEGNGHTIQNYAWTQPGGDAGLFRYVQEGARIRNLTLIGKVQPAGSGDCVGGIAAHNYGSIENCGFQGMVLGDSSIGGIAGVNEESGEITGCHSLAVINGNHSAGGIAGENYGVIRNCENNGEVNTYGTEVSYGLDDLTVETLEDITSAENVNAHTDSGGIAGLSEGGIYDCRNNGHVGYSHVGYNTGGILGRMKKGDVRGCVNKGLVQGRKDVGGIVGQQEPFLMLSYLSDKLTELDKETDVMLDLLEDCYDDMHAAGGDASTLLKSVTDNLKAASDAAGSVRGTAEELWRVYNQELTGVSNDMSELGNRIDGWDTGMNDIVVSGGDVIGGEGWKDHFNQERDSYADALRDFVKNAGTHLKNVTNASGSGADQVSEHLKKMDQRITAACDELEKLPDVFRKGNDKLQDDMDAVSEQAKVLRGVISGIRDDLLDGEMPELEDVSDETAKEQGADYNSAAVRQGRIEECRNLGDVEADTNVGGIVGLISIEYDLDPEEDIFVAGDKSLEAEGSARAIVRGCINEGAVQAKKDDAGGIAGKANFGALIGCQAYGKVSSTGGSRVGGIAGVSAGMIRGCYALCSLTGANQVGGIAGEGTGIVYSCSMSELLSEGENTGNIAGKIRDGGKLYANFFVENGMGGVDGISYAEGAMPLSYAQLAALEEIPEQFKSFRVTFVIEGETVVSYVCEYGQSLRKDQIPPIPEREGYYAKWQENVTEPVVCSRVFEAEYLPWVTGLESSGKGENGRAKLLAEGEFQDGWQLLYDETENSFSIVDEENNACYDGAVTVRYLQTEEEKNGAWRVLVWDNGNWQETESHMSGSYLVFEMRSPGKFMTEQLPKDYHTLYTVITIAAAVVVLLVLILVRRRLKKKKAAGKKKPKKQPKQKKQK